MSEFIVKAVPIDGLNWSLRPLLQSLDSQELGETEWWRRMAMLQNAAARSGDECLLKALDKKKKDRWGTSFEAPEVISQNNLPPLSIEECVKRWFQKLGKEKQQEVLKQALSTLFNATDDKGIKNIFSKKQHWMAIYKVLNEQLGILIKQNEFHTYVASITPDNCPSNKRISSSTMTNYSKTIYSNRNPYHVQCRMFWSIIINLYYAEVSTNE